MSGILEEFADTAINFAMDNGCQFCDVRAEKISQEGINLENGEIEFSISRKDEGLGIRVLNSGAWGFFSISNPISIDVVKEGVLKACKIALHSSKNKKRKVEISETASYKDKIDFPVLKKPTINEICEIGYDCDKIIRDKKRIIRSVVNLSFSSFSKYFVNSDDSKITQNFTDVIANLTAVAYESGLTQSVNVTEGGRGGLEKITEENKLEEASRNISEKASALIDAKHAKSEEGVVVMNPDFVGLLTHEILGHPSEADRVLGKEMAWAGGAWWAGKLGMKIGSDSLNVFDDPTIEGSLGWYEFDDEGVKSTKTNLVEDGVLTNHMQSRETAKIFDEKPSGNMRATSYRFMPLIRMACTCIGKGDWNKDEMISEVKNGFLISNMKIPSIDMKRYNWSISCQYAHKIENGEITDLLRDVIVMGTAPEFFKSIDACGNDFTVRPITNCGKGDPMQSMMMGNGGPSIRAIATVKSVDE